MHYACVKANSCYKCKRNKKCKEYKMFKTGEYKKFAISPEKLEEAKKGFRFLLD